MIPVGTDQWIEHLARLADEVPPVGIGPLTVTGMRRVQYSRLRNISLDFKLAPSSQTPGRYVQSDGGASRVCLDSMAHRSAR
jgi:hypothetical protein